MMLYDDSLILYKYIIPVMNDLSYYYNFCYLVDSVQRFMGLEPNAREVQLYGIISPEELEKKAKQMNTPNIQLIDSEAD